MEIQVIQVLVIQFIATASIGIEQVNVTIHEAVGDVILEACLVLTITVVEGKPMILA